jgi:hypothetical protein
MEECLAWRHKQLDAEEQLALAASGPHGANESWRTEPWGVSAGEHLESLVIGLGALARADQEVAVHMARHDPRQVLADVRAKRTVLELYEQARDHAEQLSPGAEDLLSTVPPDAMSAPLAAVRAYGRATRALTVGYRHRPGWKDQWTA